MNKLILPGLKPVLEILHLAPENVEKVKLKLGMNNPLQEEIKKICDLNDIPLTFISAQEMDNLCKCSHIAHQGIAAFLKKLPEVALPIFLANAKNAPLPLILALDQLKDPGNLGTLARTAYALGIGGLIYPIHNSVGITPAALKSSAGALTALPVCTVTNLARALDKAEEEGFTIYGTGNSTQKQINAFSMTWDLPAVLVLGNEGTGIRPGVLKRCKEIINIPFTRSFDSLNVAQAGGILIGLCASQTYQANNMDLLSE